MTTVANEQGGYRYIPGIPPYSAGVRADDGHLIVRTTMRRSVGWEHGFEVIDATLDAAGRPSQALCAVELRCPEPHSFGGFGSFNDDYRLALAARRILLSDGTNPVARTNVAPSIDATATSTGAPDTDPDAEARSGTELHAFSYTAPRSIVAGQSALEPAGPSFVIAGAGDLRDQADLRPEAIVGGTADWSTTGPARADAVLDEMEARLQQLGLSWADTDSVVVYSAERIGAVVESTVLPRLGPVARRGLHWYHARPPIEGLRFEMDTRGGVVERTL